MHATNSLKVYGLLYTIWRHQIKRIIPGIFSGLKNEFGNIKGPNMRFTMITTNKGVSYPTTKQE
ncbi:hypothetical protein HanPI659440_Chr10g0395821 [Helianthus annuus]|nr:hypothetical protein HanPI659440_Chr10g0395821 [Helianthus annuus]